MLDVETNTQLCTIITAEGRRASNLSEYQMNLIVCVGTGNSHAHSLAQEIALQHALPYHSILCADTILKTGVYHTSIYDITPAQLQARLQAHQCGIILLDQSQESYNNPQDFATTINMMFELKKYFAVQYQNPNCVPWTLAQLHTNPAFCIMPFVGLYKSQKEVGHCCLMQPIADSDSEIFDSWSQNIKESMLNGQRVKECDHCWQKENLGITSPRQNFTQTWSSKFNINTQQDVNRVAEPLYVYVVLDNRCNAMCRMCVPGSSHLIAREYRSIGLVNYKNHKKQNIFDHVNIDVVQCLHVAGGEPTINAEFFKFLDRCLEKGRNDIEFEISTNASVLSTRMLEYVEKFPNMNFSISVDGYDQLNRYIRWPIKWDNWCANVAKLHSLGRVINFNTVISIYNIAHLFDLYNFLDQEYVKIHCSVNFVNDLDNGLSAWNYPDPEEIIHDLQLIKQLKRYQQDQDFQNTIQGIENLARTYKPDTQSLQKFFEFNQRLDHSRGVELGSVLPTLDKYHQ